MADRAEPTRRAMPRLPSPSAASDVDHKARAPRDRGPTISRVEAHGRALNDRSAVRKIASVEALLNARLTSAPQGGAARRTAEGPEGSDGATRRTPERPVPDGRAAVAQREAERAPNRTGLPDKLKAGIEAMSGLPMDDVRVHRNSAKPEQLQALAYARGNEIHLGPGQEQHLAHEAWHVVQQKRGRVSPTRRISGIPINDDASLEHEADAATSRLPTQMKGQDDALTRPASTHAVSQLAITIGNDKLEVETDEQIDIILKIISSSEVQEAIRRAGIERIRAEIRNFDGQIIGKKALQKKIAALRKTETIEEKSKEEKTEHKGAPPPAKDFGRHPDALPNTISKKGHYVGIGQAVLFDGLKKLLGLSSIAIQEVCFKAGLVSTFVEGGAPVVEMIGAKLNELLQASKQHEVDKAGIAYMFEVLTSPWGKQASAYLDTNDSAHMIFGGLDSRASLLTSFQGIAGELDAIVSIGQSELAPGEITFSGSKYQDPDYVPPIESETKKQSDDSRKKERKKPDRDVDTMTKDVDVSYIDAAGTLHLIEVAKDVNALANKLRGTGQQNKVYKHLTQKAGRLVHTAKGPLNQAQLGQGGVVSVTSVEFCYSIPEGSCDHLDIKTMERLREVYRTLLRSKIGLRVGKERYAYTDISSLDKDLESRLAAALVEAEKAKRLETEGASQSGQKNDGET